MLHHGVLCSRYSGLGKNVLLSWQIVDVPTHLPLTVWRRSETSQLPKNKTNKHNSRSCYQCPCWQPLWKASISETWSHLAALFVSSAVSSVKKQRLVSSLTELTGPTEVEGRWRGPQRLIPMIQSVSIASLDIEKLRKRKKNEKNTKTKKMSKKKKKKNMGNEQPTEIHKSS